MEVRVPQSVVNSVEERGHAYRVRAHGAVDRAARAYVTRLYLDFGYDFSRAAIVVVEDK